MRPTALALAALLAGCATAEPPPPPPPQEPEPEPVVEVPAHVETVDEAIARGIVDAVQAVRRGEAAPFTLQ